MVIAGRAGVREFSVFSGASVFQCGSLRGWENSDRVDYPVRTEERVRANVFSLGHIKFEAPRGLRRKI